MCPLAVVVETAGHIAKCNGDRYTLATRLVEMVGDAIEGRSPWVAFGQQTPLWEPTILQTALERWPLLAARKVSLADDSISQVADYYSKLGHAVEILTGDAGLKALQPVANEGQRRRVSPAPKRRRR